MQIAVVRLHEPLNAKDAAIKVADEAADIANFAMMIADWHLIRAAAWNTKDTAIAATKGTSK